MKEPILPSRRNFGERTNAEFKALTRDEILKKFTQVLDDALQGRAANVDRRDVVVFVVGMHPEPRNMVGAALQLGGHGYAIALGTLVDLALRGKKLTVEQLDDVVEEAKRGAA